MPCETIIALMASGIASGRVLSSRMPPTYTACREAPSARQDCDLASPQENRGNRFPWAKERTPRQRQKCARRTARVQYCSGSPPRLCDVVAASVPCSLGALVVRGRRTEWRSCGQLPAGNVKEQEPAID